jgi:hypothetical protein
MESKNFRKEFLMMSIKTLLETEIQSEFEKLKDMEIGSEPYSKAVDGLAKLTDRAIEYHKIAIEDQDKVEARNVEYDLKMREIAEERRDRLIKNCLTGLSIATGVGLTVWGTVASFKFEETGTVTTIMGRGFINKLLPKK